MKIRVHYIEIGSKYPSDFTEDVEDFTYEQVVCALESYNFDVPSVKDSMYKLESWYPVEFANAACKRAATFAISASDHAIVGFVTEI